jgi:hypothetical protein
MTTINDLLDRYIPNELPKLARRTQIAYQVPDKPRPPKSRYIVVTDPGEIEAIKRAGLADPIGGVIDGQWFAEAQSLAAYRGGKPYVVKA